MIYATENGLDLIIAAADSLIEFEAFYQIAAGSPELYLSCQQPDLIEMMTLPQYRDLSHDPHVFSFQSADERAAFVETFQVQVLLHNRLVSKQQGMLAETKDDAWFGPDPEDEADIRTIAETYGLDKADAWDHRSDEQKEKDAADEKRYKDALKSGKMSGDSFGGGSSDDAVNVTDIRGHETKDGVEVTDVMAHKAGDSSAATEAGAVPIGVTGSFQDVKVFFKADIVGANVLEVMAAAALTDPDFDIDKVCVDRQDTATGCWFAFARLSLAERVAEIAISGVTGSTAEIYAVNAAGERLVPKTVKVVDEAAAEVIPPRPWNDRAGQIAKMDEEALAKNKKSLKGSEFIFAGNYKGQGVGCIIHVTPESYFDENEAPWDKPLDIGHLLPATFKEIKPGVYQARDLDYVGVVFQLCNKLGFRESLLFQVYLNEQ